MGFWKRVGRTAKEAGKFTGEAAIRAAVDAAMERWGEKLDTAIDYLKENSERQKRIESKVDALRNERE